MITPGILRLPRTYAAQPADALNALMTYDEDLIARALASGCREENFMGFRFIVLPGERRGKSKAQLIAQLERDRRARKN